MQLDFFRQLTALLPRAMRKPRTPTAATMHPGNAPELEEKARVLACALGCATLAAKIRVCWNSRMRSTAGTAHAREAVISLNPRLRDFGEAEIDRTLRHELAHLLAHHRAGRRRIAPHGPEWKRACQDLCLPNEKRCHDLPLPRRVMNARHLYRCSHCALELKRVRPMRRKTACLACCRLHNRGRYDERFRFVKVREP